MKNNKFKRIGVGVAFSPSLRANVSEAARLALAFDCCLVLIHVGNEEKAKIKTLNGFLATFKKNGLKYELVFLAGAPVDAVISAVMNNEIDLIVLGALKKESFFKYYLGSIARQITRKASCSVMLLTSSNIKDLPYNHIVVNGLEDPKTKETIKEAFYFGSRLKSSKITIVEEVDQNEININVDDDESLRKSTIIRDRLRRREKQRVKKLIGSVPSKSLENISVKSQPIFGKRGYSIGHYAQVVGADLLVMNSPSKSSFWDRIFPHDIEYILSDLPTNVLIIR